MTPQSSELLFPDQQFQTISELKNEVSIKKQELKDVLGQFGTIDNEAKVEMEQSNAENEISMLKEKLIEKESEILYLQTELETVAKEKSDLKNRSHELERFVSDLERKRGSESENMENLILKTTEVTNSNSTTSSEIIEKIQKLKFCLKNYRSELV